MSIEEQIADAIFASPTGKKKPRRASSHLDPIIEAAAKKHGVDPDLVRRVVKAESGGNTRAVSKAGAQGAMQLMPGTSRGLGVKDPFDPRQNIDGGVRYLKQQLDAFGGDEEKALAAYNAGPGAVRKYGGVPPFPETQAYVAKIRRGRLASRGGTGQTAKTPEEQIADAIFAAPAAPAAPTQSPEEQIAARIFGDAPQVPLAAPNPAAEALARRRQTLRQEPRQDVARLQPELMPAPGATNLERHPFVRSYPPRPGPLVPVTAAPAKPAGPRQPKWNEFDPFTYNIRVPDTSPFEQTVREIGGKAAEGVVGFLGWGPSLEASKRAAQQYAEQAKPVYLSKDPRTRARELAELQQLRPLLDKASGTYRKGLAEAQRKLPYTAKLWAALQMGDQGQPVDAPPPMRFPDRPIVSQQEYDRLALEAAERGLKPMTAAAYQKTLEKELGRPLTPTQKKAVGALATAERLKLVHESKILEAVAGDAANLAINYAVGLGAAGLVGKVGRGVIASQIGQRVAQSKPAQAVAAQAAKGAAKVSPLFREAFVKTIDPAQHIGAGASNVALAAMEEAGDPNLTPEQQRARLNRAFVEGVKANLGIEAIIQGVLLGRHFKRGGGRLRGAELSRALDEMGDPDLAQIRDTVRQGESKGAVFGVVENEFISPGLVEVGREARGMVAVREVSNPEHRFTVPVSSLQRFPSAMRGKAPTESSAIRPQPELPPVVTQARPGLGTAETQNTSPSKGMVPVVTPRRVEPPPAPAPPRPMKQPSTAKPSRPLAGDDRFAVDETVPVDERVEITHLGNLRRKGNAPFSRGETDDILELADVQRGTGKESEFQLRVEDEEAIRIARETGNSGKWHKATDLPEEHFDLWRERVGNRIRTAQTVAEALADEGTLDAFVQARRKWEVDETQAVQKRELRAADRELKGTRDDPQFLIDTAKGGSLDGPHTIVPEWFTAQDLRDIHAHLTKGGKRGGKTYPNPEGEGTLTLAELLENRLLPPDAFESAGAEASRTLRQKMQATATDPLDRYLKSLGGKKQVYANDVLKAQAEGGEIPASKGYGLSVNEAANLRRNLKNAQERATKVKPSGPTLKMQEGPGRPAGRVGEAQPIEIKRGRQAIEDRLKVEVEERGLDPKVAEATREFLGLFPDKYLAELGSHYYAGKRIPADLVDGATNATGFYAPMDALIGIAREGVSTSRRGKRVPAHEIGHHLENFVPPKDYTELQKAYEADKAKTQPGQQRKLESLQRQFDAATEAGEKTRLGTEIEDLQAQGYRYESFHEWFSENVVDRGMRDIYPEDPVQRTLIQRVVRTIREVLKRIETYFTGKQRQDLIEEVYGKLRKGEYEAVSRYGRQMGIQKYDVPEGALPSVKITLGEKKAEAETEKVQSFKTEAIPAAPNASESPKSSPSPVTEKPDDGVTITETERKAAVKALPVEANPDGLVSLANVVKDAQVESGRLGKQPTKGETFGPEDALALGKRAIDEGRINPFKLADELADGADIAITPERIGALLHGAAELRKKVDDLTERRTKAEDAGNRQQVKVLDAQIEAAQVELDAYMDKIHAPINTAWHNVGMAIASVVELDTGSYSSVMRTLRRKHGVGPENLSEGNNREIKAATRVSKEANEGLRAENPEITRLKMEQEQLRVAHAAELAQLKQDAEVEVQRVKGEYESRAAEKAKQQESLQLKEGKDPGNERVRTARRRAIQREAIAREKKALSEEFAKIKVPGLASGIPTLEDIRDYPRAMGLARRWVGVHIAEGKLNLDEILEQGVEQFRQYGYRATHTDLLNAFLKRDAPKEKTPEQQQQAGMRAEARKRKRLIDQLEGRTPVRVQRPKREVSPGTQALREQVVEQRRTVQAKRSEEAKARALAKRNAALDAQIADLKQQIGTGELKTGDRRGPGTTDPRRQQLAALRSEKAKIQRIQRELAGALPTRPKPAPDAPSPVRQGLMAQVKANREAAKLTRMEARKADLEEQLRTGSLAPRGKALMERTALETELSGLSRRIAVMRRNQEIIAGTRPAVPKKRANFTALTEAEQRAQVQASIKRVTEERLEWERRLREQDYAGAVAQQQVVDEALADARALRDIAKRNVLQAIENARPKTGWDRTLEAVGAVRGTILGGDIGVLFRQGLLMWSRPVTALRASRKALKAMFSEVEMAKHEAEIRDREWNGRKLAVIRKKAGLAITDTLTQPEEMLWGQAVQNIPVLRVFTTPGKALDRFQTTFLNSLRADVFDQAVEQGMTEGELALRAQFINAATGRGNIKSVPKIAQVIFTSPRYEMSRWETIASPAVNVYHLANGARKGELNRAAVENLRDFVVTGAGVVGILMLSRFAGYEVDMNPTSSDFGKMRHGDEVTDITAGIAPRLRDMARLVARIWDTEQPDAGETASRMLLRTLSPAVKTPAEQLSIAVQKAQGVKEPKLYWEAFKAPEERQGLMTFAPLILQSTWESAKTGDMGRTATVAAREFVGIGVHRYPKPRGTKRPVGFGTEYMPANPGETVKKVDAELQRLGVGIPRMGDKLEFGQGEAVKMPPEVIDRIRHRAGTLAAQRVAHVLYGKDDDGKPVSNIPKMPDPLKREKLQAKVIDAKKDAKDKDPWVKEQRAKWEARKSAERQALMKKYKENLDAE